MLIFRDISEYYVGDKAIQEEQAWIQSNPHPQYVAFLHEVLKKYNLKKVVEVGCGSGIVPKLLSQEYFYLGADKNQFFVELSKAKNTSNRQFICEDVRKLNNNEAFIAFSPFDICTSWAFTKHFGLHEWDELYAKMLSYAPYSIHMIDFSDRDHDDGVDFHHVVHTKETVAAVIKKAGHELIKIDVFDKRTMDNGHPLETLVYTTRKIQPRQAKLF